ncbi:MAG: hypothetical protein EKK55_12480 [Rhodocyclaceae bacterium]|nr:MAG: hypothetical protein EKK55_12480 [Rhodocyclaceae bacterium]
MSADDETLLRDFVADLPERSRRFIELVREHGTLTWAAAMSGLGLDSPKALGGVTGTIGRWAPIRGVTLPYESVTIEGERAWVWRFQLDAVEPEAQPEAVEPKGNNEQVPDDAGDEDTSHGGAEMQQGEVQAVVISRGRELLPVPLTAQEELDRHRQLQELAAEVEAIDLRLAAAKAAATSAKAALTERRQPILAEVRSRTREAPVEVAVELHPTLEGHIRRRRLDTGEVIESREMKPSERQQMLALDDAHEAASAAVEPEFDAADGDTPPWLAGAEEQEEDEVAAQGREAALREDASWLNDDDVENPYADGTDEALRWRRAFDEAAVARDERLGSEAASRGEEPPEGASQAFLNGYGRVRPLRVVRGRAENLAEAFARMTVEQIEAKLDGAEPSELAEIHTRLIGAPPKKNARASSVAATIRRWHTQNHTQESA